MDQGWRGTRVGGGAHLHKQRDGLQVGDLCSVDGISGQDVQRSRAALHNLLHPHAVLTTDMKETGVTDSSQGHRKDTQTFTPQGSVNPSMLLGWGGPPSTPREADGQGESSHLVRLRVGGTVFLGVLVSFEQQVDQAGNGSGIPQGGLVLRAEGQVTDQTDHGLGGAGAET